MAPTASYPSRQMTATVNCRACDVQRHEDCTGDKIGGEWCECQCNSGETPPGPLKKFVPPQPQNGRYYGTLS